MGYDRISPLYKENLRVHHKWLPFIVEQQTLSSLMGLLFAHGCNGPVLLRSEVCLVVRHWRKPSYATKSLLTLGPSPFLVSSITQWKDIRKAPPLLDSSSAPGSVAAEGKSLALATLTMVPGDHLSLVCLSQVPTATTAEGPVALQPVCVLKDHGTKEANVRLSVAWDKEREIKPERACNWMI